jgi:hypothetical protein
MDGNASRIGIAFVLLMALCTGLGAGYVMGKRGERARLAGEHTVELERVQRDFEGQLADATSELNRERAVNSRLEQLNAEAVAIVGESAKLLSSDARSIQDALNLVRGIRGQIQALAALYVRGVSPGVDGGLAGGDDDGEVK